MSAVKNMRKLRVSDVDFIEIIKHSFWAFFMLAIAAASQFLFDLLLAQNLGAEDAGVFYLVFTVLSMGALFGRLGLHKAVIRFMPALVRQHNWSEIQGVKKTATRYTVGASLFIAALIFLASDFIAGTIFDLPQLAKYIKLFALPLPLLSLVYLQAGTLTSLKAIKESVFLERASIYIFAIPILLVVGYNNGLNGVFLGYGLSVFAAYLLGRILLAKKIQKADNAARSFDGRSLLWVALPLMFIEFSNQFVGQLNVIFLGIFSTTENVAIFNVSLKISLLISIILTGVNTITTTKISEVFSGKDRLKLETLASKAAALAMICGLPLILLLLLFPNFVLRLFGSEFIAGSDALRILVLGQIVNLMVGSVVQLLAMTGNEKVLAKVIIGTSIILNGLLCIWFVPLYGVIGASIAVSLTIIFKNLILLCIVRNRLGFWSSPLKAFGIWANSFKR